MNRDNQDLTQRLKIDNRAEKRRVLVVDPLEINRRTADFLAFDGYQVDTAPDVLTALELLIGDEPKRPDYLAGPEGLLKPGQQRYFALLLSIGQLTLGGREGSWLFNGNNYWHLATQELRSQPGPLGLPLALYAARLGVPNIVGAYQGCPSGSETLSDHAMFINEAQGYAPPIIRINDSKLVMMPDGWTGVFYALSNGDYTLVNPYNPVSSSFQYLYTNEKTGETRVGKEWLEEARQGFRPIQGKNWNYPLAYLVANSNRNKIESAIDYWARDEHRRPLRYRL
jgi:hypothetical protein